jgi:phosphoribosylformylglycinamidine cyclo-ligase
MHRTFNCGIGMVLCVAQQDVDKTLEILTAQGEHVSVIGRIEAAGNGQQVILN